MAFQSDRNSGPKRVLCVEDEQSQLLLHRLVFERAGYVFVGVQTAAEGIRHFSEARFDVVILDYWLPEMKGVELAEHLKRLETGTPIVIVSGLAPLPGEDAGVNGWLQKGNIKPEALLEEVEHVVGLARSTNNSP